MATTSPAIAHAAETTPHTSDTHFSASSNPRPRNTHTRPTTPAPPSPAAASHNPKVDRWDDETVDDVIGSVFSTRATGVHFDHQPELAPSTLRYPVRVTASSSAHPALASEV
ncbi:hypothetical protein [Pilimelia columellifera]|uniref:Uncharacterized protein n=1 Tax=Pilimelia columellifera subsp. columellifera TaxID=706583 RepID=A0ABP6B185_9ACTN